MINILFLIGIIGVAIIVVLPFIFLSNKPISLQPGIMYELLPPGYRSYTISVPNGYSRKRPAPQILVLHDAGHGIPFYGEMIPQNMIKPAFRELEPIIISPDCPAKTRDQPKSEQLIFDMIDKIHERFKIDPIRILITGYSLGGIGAWHFAGRYPDQFSAAIVIAWSPPDDVLEIEWRIPLMIIHIRDDEEYPLPETKKTVLKLEKRGFDIEHRILEVASHYEINYYVAALRNTIRWLLEAWEK